MTQLIYGGYFHAPNSVYLQAWNRQTILSDNGWPIFLRINASFRAKLLDVNMNGLMSQAYAMQQAYSVGGQSLVFRDNNGVNTAWFLDNSQTIGGVMVTQPVSFGEIKGAEGTTYMHCTFAVQADFPVAPAWQIIEFRETVEFSDIGGGPMQIERVPMSGAPIIQNVTDSSFFYANQQGELKQAGPNPNPMDPLWPDLFRGTPDSRRVTLLSPKTIRGNPWGYGVSWSYKFVSTSPFPPGVPGEF